MRLARDVMKIFFPLAALAAALSANIPQAQAYPTRPIRLVVPFPAGGTADVIARSIANEASTLLGQPFVIDNRGGANSIIGSEIVAKAPPDGYTMLYVTAALVINPHVYLKLPYDALRDFDPVTNGVLGTGYLVVLHPSVPANSVKELVALARDGKVSYSSPGVGNTLHLAAELFATRAGVKLLHVPYKGVAPALNAVLAGEVQITLIPPTIVMSQIKAGRVKAIGFTGSSRFPGMSQLLTMTEAGIPNLELTGAWHGWFVPAKTPASVIARLQQEVAKSLHAPRVREAIVAGGYEPDGRSPEEFRKFLRAEYERYGEMVKAANLQKTGY
jgi:tripartite-type tricarboxylate transporter receptor subunit TctC